MRVRAALIEEVACGAATVKFHFNWLRRFLDGHGERPVELIDRADLVAFLECLDRNGWVHYSFSHRDSQS